MVLRHYLSLFLCLYLYFPTLSASHSPLASTESDPDSFIQNSVNVINGDYCESITDLVIQGPDALILQRFYSTMNPITGNPKGGWRMLPQRFLVVGKNPSNKTCMIGSEQFEEALAFTGERSGGIFPYSGWRNINGTTKDPLKIDVLNALGMVNTYAKEINGQTNHQNNLLHCKDGSCELILGDGTKRIYKQVKELPSLLLGEELTPAIAAQVLEPKYFLLTQEILPSGNQLLFTYDDKNHLISIEMRNKTLTKTHSWLHLTYDLQDKGCQVHIKTSDFRELTYHLELQNNLYQLTRVEGSHCIPISYEYQEALTKKVLPERRFVEIEYQDGKVKSLKGPHPQSGKVTVFQTFSYGKHHTDVFNAIGVKTRYIYDNRFQLTAIERYDDQNNLYRIEQKFWGKTKLDAGLLLAKTIGDGNDHIYSHRSFNYDKSGNVIEERLYGNLTGKQEVSLQVSTDGRLLNPDEEECNLKTFAYSTDGFNLLIKMGDCKGNRTQYSYKPGTNLLIKKRILDQGTIKKRTTQYYNDDAVCVKIIEDNGTEEEETKYLYDVTERHIKEIKVKEMAPGIGLPETIEERAFDAKNKKEFLLKRLVNVYDEQSNLLSCSTYDANGQYAFTEQRTYNALGLVTSQIDGAGRETSYEYDGLGNQTLVSIPHESRFIITNYDFQNQPIQITEITGEGQFITRNTYDILGRKITSIDHFSNSTNYEYDAFNRLTKVIHPNVLDENNQVISPTFSYTYDLFGNVIATKDPKGFITKKSYNLRGDPTKISYPDGTFELFKYDTEGALHRSLTRDQLITVYEYDYLGRSVYEETSVTTDIGIGSFSYVTGKTRKYNGFRCTYEKQDDHVKEYTLDAAGRLISFREHAYDNSEKGGLYSHQTDITYNPFGQIQRKKVWFDKGPQDYTLECFEYDVSGNVIEKRIENAQGAVLLKKYFSYNTQNQCIEEYGIENGIKISLVKTSYNSKGEPIGYVDGSGQETKIIINNSYQNNLRQKVLKKTLVNPMGVQTEIEFDALSRVYNITKKDPFGVLLSSQKILYDSLGNKACEIHDQIVDGKVIGSQKTRWIYGPTGRLEEEVEAADTALEKQIRFSYNSLGQLTSKTVPGTSIPINYIYNKDRRLQKIEVQDKKNELLQISNTYSYDRHGNITDAHTLDGKAVHRTYNGFHQIIKEVIKDDEGSYKLQYIYDRQGRLTEVLLPDQSKIVYIYDAAFGREIKRISPQGTVLYNHTYDQYDSLGKLLQETRIGYVGTTEYSYDLNGQRISSKNDFADEQYKRDSLGRVLEVKGNKHEEYSYNSLSQLTLEKKTNPKTYAYDSLDNRIKVNDENLLYNNLNQLTKTSKAEFSYDPQGNLLRKVLNGEETRFENNLLSQLIFIEKVDKTVLNFSYDALGRILVEKHTDSKGRKKKTFNTTRYFYIGNQQIGTLTETGLITTLKVPGLQGDQLSNTSIAFEIKGKAYAPMHDVAGNVVSLINPQTRDVVESYNYTAFGEETIYNSNGEIQEYSVIGNPWRFAEKHFDQNSGLILFGLRFYDPMAGRWTSQDPARFIDGTNLYAYVHNNPINNLDRFGLATEVNTQNKFDQYFYGEVESHCYCEKHRTCKRGGDIRRTSGSSLPKITYCDHFEKYYSDLRDEDLYIENCYDDSICYDLKDEGLPDLPNDLGIGFINGIWNDHKSARESAKYISRLAGGYNIHGVYNATHGTFIDVAECGLGLNYIATDPVKQLHKMWNSFFEKSSANARFLMICHSQGAIHVRNALLDYPPELRDRIIVVAIAPGGYIYQETCVDVLHYRAGKYRDFVPRLDKDGAKREAAKIVDLTSHPDAALFDHEFMSPTYRDILLQHIRNYIKTQGTML